MESAVEATRLGAYRYVAPPFSIRELFEVVVEAASTEGDFLTVNEADAQKGVAGLVGSSGVMKELFMKIAMGANSSATILIRGATGTGKELIAKALHQYSSRADQPFTAVNCTAIPPSLIESELFGHEQGAFTGAGGRRLGIFEAAHKGTLFFDEIGDLAPGMQVKLLRVLQEREICRIGGRQRIQVDVKVIAPPTRIWRS